MVEAKLVSKSGDMPKYETSGAAGMDLRACIDEPITLEVGKIKLIPTGLFIEIPHGYEAQVRARSGLALKHGITLINAVGTVDSDYRGEIKVPLINLGEEDFVINNGERIAQMIIARYEQVEWQLVEKLDELSDTKRGQGGFGHTGK
ncbi:MAG: dUTP diphosphatase [Eubacteriales bacterium]|nr:dUTP diphosphatase [Eubacteriales bacterium]